jgi:dihydrofolate reductase
LPLADAMALTHITLQIAGDAHFPAWDAQQWQVAWQPQQVAANGLTYQFADYTRR